MDKGLQTAGGRKPVGHELKNIVQQQAYYLTCLEIPGQLKKQSARVDCTGIKASDVDFALTNLHEPGAMCKQQFPPSKWPLDQPRAWCLLGALAGKLEKAGSQGSRTKNPSNQATQVFNAGLLHLPG